MKVVNGPIFSSDKVSKILITCRLNIVKLSYERDKCVYF